MSWKFCSEKFCGAVRGSIVYHVTWWVDASLLEVDSFIVTPSFSYLARILELVPKGYMDWLVVWNMAFIFPIILGISYSQLTNSIIFQRGSNHQPATYFNHTWQRWATSTVGDAIPGRRCCCYMAVRRMRGLGSILASGKVDVLF